jgi:hypothetical protein
MRSLTMEDISDTNLSLRNRDHPEILKMRDLTEKDHQDVDVEKLSSS